MKTLGVIPARLASSRLPGKMLLSETGKPLIQYAWEVASAAASLDEVVVAADSQEIVDVVRGFGGNAVLTEEHPSGTDRVAEVVSSRSDVGTVVNIQGDEPELLPSAIDQVIDLMADGRSEMATLATPFGSAAEVRDPGNVKCVRATDGRALYFSREAAPHLRDSSIEAWFADAAESELPVRHCPWLLHLGIYAYERNFLLALSQMPPSTLEQYEKLEQLRALEAGATIRVGITTHRSVGIDTAEDYAQFVVRQKAEDDLSTHDIQ